MDEKGKPAEKPATDSTEWTSSRNSRGPGNVRAHEAVPATSSVADPTTYDKLEETDKKHRYFVR